MVGSEHPSVLDQMAGMAATTASTSGDDARQFSEVIQMKLMASGDDLWNSEHLVSSLSKNFLAHLCSLFVDLQTQAKLKLLLSLLHVSKRNLEQWRKEVNELLYLAAQDADEWVQIVAELLKPFPERGTLNLSTGGDDTAFGKQYEEIRRILASHTIEAEYFTPLHAFCVSRRVVESAWGCSVQPKCHFTLKRKPKAAAQRVELLHKSSDVASQGKHKKGSLSSVVPIRARNMVRTMAENKESPKEAHSKDAARNVIKSPVKVARAFPPVKQLSRANVHRKEGLVKVIEIDETPQALRTKRKTLEAQERAAKKAAKEEQKKLRKSERLEQMELRKPKVASEVVIESSGGSPVAAAGASEVSAAKVVVETPDYAAQLFSDSLTNYGLYTDSFSVNMPATTTTPSSPAEQSTSGSKRSILENASGITDSPKDDYASASASPPAQEVPSPSTTAPSDSVTLLRTTTSSGLPQVPKFSLVPSLSSSWTATKTSSLTESVVFSSPLSVPPAPRLVPQTFVKPSDKPSSVLIAVKRDDTLKLDFSEKAATSEVKPDTVQNQDRQRKQVFRISRERMLEAQEMFRTANKLTRSEKALILGFLAGNKENPFPQLGHLITIRLSENEEIITHPDGKTRKGTVETFFQMDYETGLCNKVRKVKPLETEKKATT